MKGLDFNEYAGRSITVEEMVAGMAGMGFQATSVGQAVKVIERMVAAFPCGMAHSVSLLTYSRGPGAIRKPPKRQHFFSDTRQI